MVYQADRPVTILEILAEAGGIANDAGDTVIVSRPSQEPSADLSEPPAIGTEDPGLATVPKDSAPTGGAKESAAKTLFPAPTSAASPNVAGDSSASNPPPPLTNTITINLNELVESGNATNNIILQAGDIVTVPHAGIVYVLGAVSRPGGFVLANDRSQMTTLKLLALSGGLSPTARKDHAVIIRKDSQGQQHQVAVDLKKVMDRTGEDIQLQPSDILYVPSSIARQAMIRAVEVGVALGTSLALYRVVTH
jgi:protein involved in polysaccharide export with SLBB domain